jgi:glyoxylase-like metal-dependent hydrolase (beta-lactamase superfamily II)
LYNFKSEIREIEGIYQIKIDVPFAVKYVCLYLFEIDGNKVLIDAGLNMGNWKRKLISALDKIGLNINDINYCIVSHIHLDHIGLVKTLKRKNPELKIVMNDITHKILKWETSEGNLKEMKEEANRVADLMVKYGIAEDQSQKVVQFFTFWPRYLQYQKPDIIVNDGDTILEDLEIIWTPGHSFGHICIFNKKRRYLFVGDHILSRITPHIGNFVISPALRDKYKNHNFDNILHHYLKSLDRIDNFAPKIIFPAHQDIIYNPHQRILEIKKHHGNRLQEISSVIKNNPLTPYEISKIHFGNNLDEINSYMAMSEVLGHLIYLDYQNMVKKVEKNGKLLFYT